MRFYEAKTFYLGASAPTTRYFEREDNALTWIEYQGNGEFYPIDDNRVKTIPEEGCTWDDIRYWNDF